MANAHQEEGERTIHQPLYPSVRPLLDPEYVAFHDKHVQYVEPEQLRPWTPSNRTRYTWPYAGSSIVEVGNVKDIRPCGDFSIRVFSPAGSPPASGWPLLIWFHGGGFAAGNIDSDNDLCSLACRDVGCVVANVDYRLAPEHPYPAAVEDVAALLHWITKDKGAANLNINTSKIALGGASAGANLAAVGALMAVELSIPIALQVLVVPVIDNTATLGTGWSAHPHAPWLTAPRMTFYRDLYLAQSHLAMQWKASPKFAPPELLSRLPRTWIAIAGEDMLSTEGLEYARALSECGVETEVRTYDGMPHTMLSLSGVLTKGRQAMQDILAVLRSAFDEPESAVLYPEREY
ncbi:hypothetical protein PMZ80_009769 [Knufia obscura]|uniref:Alpha/beta hydrolase fold-3 domain-containing protein n=1 Tax=Knufia obscura TaxID=1635080 RepID=A0ABR0RD60_9EURO|nr:hypothetical protein PMZ80_009769 [Knufia obscura]